eukprot:1160313-Pleurochrysis_carterae.AAC.1
MPRTYFFRPCFLRIEFLTITSSSCSQWAIRSVLRIWPRSHSAAVRRLSTLERCSLLSPQYVLRGLLVHVDDPNPTIQSAVSRVVEHAMQARGREAASQCN